MLILILLLLATPVAIAATPERIEAIRVDGNEVTR